MPHHFPTRMYLVILGNFSLPIGAYPMVLSLSIHQVFLFQLMLSKLVFLAQVFWFGPSKIISLVPKQLWKGKKREEELYFRVLEKETGLGSLGSQEDKSFFLVDTKKHISLQRNKSSFSLGSSGIQQGPLSHSRHKCTWFPSTPNTNGLGCAHRSGTAGSHQASVTEGSLSKLGQFPRRTKINGFKR